ncbi:YibQ protein [Actibacterium atlanticum]|uniref:YibQ protein n=1 Tax=Actibacterium atlanticum TaxID=1461693 RepID=A0A058ZQ89_9RHOB|nr:divergent polysaccharide deacetylase family protein [Actibacterium atlanticum]KCV83420.1 YibQ protein [Actibacterium atlanticum]
MRSVAGGLTWGVVASAVGLTVFSLTAPMRDSSSFAPSVPATDSTPDTTPPQMEPAAAPETVPVVPLEPDAEPVEAPTTGQVDLPPGSEFNKPAEDGAATVSQPDDPAVPGTSAPALPGGSTQVEPPNPDTNPGSAPAPGTAVPDGITAPDAAVTDPALPPTGEEPVLPNPESATPQVPEADPAPTPPIGQIGEAPAPIGSGAAAIGLPQPGFTFETPNVRTGRLPSVGQDPEPAPEVDPEPVNLGALARNAVPFKRSGDKPLMSIVIVDEGDSGLDRATLSTISFPVAFAIDAARPDAVEAMRAYRKAGFETILMTGGLPAGATPQDLEVTLQSYMAQMDQTIALMDVEGGILGSSRALQTQLIQIAEDSGHGVVSFDRGLKTIDQMAKAAKVPSALIYRSIDDQAESAPVIRRVLKRAAFKAGQDGAVVMLGHSRPETVTALFEWALEGSTEVDLAPLSEVLKFRW